MEREVVLKTKDGHNIYGMLTLPRRATRRLVVFVHGLTGHKNEHLFYNGARFFARRGVASFRFDLYSGEKGGRSLMNCTCLTHAGDIDAVVKRFQKRFSKIYLVGHSLGGPSVLMADVKKIFGIVLWDPSSRATLLKLAGKIPRLGSSYVLKWGTEHLVGKKMRDEWLRFSTPEQLTGKITVPLLVLCAGKGILKKGGMDYCKYAKGPSRFAVIKNAGHCFDENETAQDLLLETAKWIRRH